MEATCARCDAPLEAAVFDKCPSCLIEEMAAGARQRLEEEPWGRLPERWQRLAEGWRDFPPEFQNELKAFLVEAYDRKRSERPRRSQGNRQRYIGTPERAGYEADSLELVEADIAEWSA